MSINEPATGASDAETRTGGRDWNWLPELPLRNSPLFTWPPQPVKSLKWIAASWLGLTERVFYVLFAVVSWAYLQPALERSREFEFGWIAQMHARNLTLILLVAGGLHLYFHTFRKQGTTRKYDPRDLARNSRSFTWRDQVRDNMFWSLASGVTLWTAYEALFIWAYANGHAPFLNGSDNPVWFALLFLLIPVWEAFHFYWIHQFLHWKPLYRIAHSLHHRNVNVGPWSGISMHPIEHLIYFSSVLIHLAVPSHPIHIFFHMYWLTLGAATSHSGFASLMIKDKSWLALGFFHHQLHHRYFECNYGNAGMPLDKWFGSFHDGTSEATERMRGRRRRMHGIS